MRKLAGLAFLGCLQFLMVEAICASAFAGRYSYFQNYISDLGATGCGVIAQVCSPLHPLMNASFALQGALIGAGAILLWSCWSVEPSARRSLICLMLCALGIVLVALAPEDVASSLHYAGAVLHLIPCNLALLFFSQADRRPPLPRLLFGLAGLLGLVGVFGSGLHVYLGLGPGGMGRVAAYPFLLTLAGSGAALLRGEVTSASGLQGRPEFPEA